MFAVLAAGYLVTSFRAPGLTMRFGRRVIVIDQGRIVLTADADDLRGVATAVFINSKPSYVLPRAGESPLSGAVASWAATMGIVMGGLFDNGRGRTMRVLGSRC